MSEQTPEAQFDVAAALVTTPLYAEIPAREPWKLAKTLRTFDGPIDLFCPSCGRESTYTSKPDMEAKTWANRASAALVSNSAAQNTYLQQQVAWLTPFSRVFTFNAKIPAW
jgi:hypothetical protein